MIIEKYSNRFITGILIAFLLIFSGGPAHGEDGQEETRTPILLTRAVMCENIEAFDIQNPAIVFSISLGKIFCFSSFENIQKNDIVFHKWFQRDRLVSNNRFYLQPPAWSIFSTMQLRMADRGPWRVEITDNSGIILKTLRFSISD